MTDETLRVGVLTPHLAVGPEEELPAMAPWCVVAPVVRLFSAVDLDRAAETLLADPVDAVVYASTTWAYAVGFDAETSVLSRLEAHLGVAVVSTCASAVDALHVLGVERLALIGAPWFDPALNELGAAYFRSQGFELVSSRSAELSLDPARIEAGAVYDWAARNVADDADAVFIGGNGFRAAAAIEGLEVALGRPVVTSNQVLLWNVLARADVRCEIDGYGRLFEHLSGRGTITQ